MLQQRPHTAQLLCFVLVLSLHWETDRWVYATSSHYCHPVRRSGFRLRVETTSPCENLLQNLPVSLTRTRPHRTLFSQANSHLLLCFLAPGGPVAAPLLAPWAQWSVAGSVWIERRANQMKTGKRKASCKQQQSPQDCQYRWRLAKSYLW